MIYVVELLQKLLIDDELQKEVFKWLTDPTFKIYSYRESTIENMGKIVAFESFLQDLEKYIIDKRINIDPNYMMKVYYHHGGEIVPNIYTIHNGAKCYPLITDVHKIIFDCVVHNETVSTIGEARLIAVLVHCLDWDKIINPVKSLEDTVAEHYANKVNKLYFVFLIQRLLMPIAFVFVAVVFIWLKITKQSKSFEQILREYYLTYLIKDLPNILLSNSHFRRNLDTCIQIFLFSECDHGYDTRTIKKCNFFGSVYETIYYEIFDKHIYIHQIDYSNKRVCRIYKYDENKDLLYSKDYKYTITPVPWN